MHGDRPGGRVSLPLPEEVEGPPAPPEFRDIVAADDGQMARYSQMYENQMARTRGQRDSVKAALAQIHSAFEAGDRDAARGNMSTARSLGDDIRKSDESFDDAANGLLRKDQQKRYAAWKKARKQQWDERRKEARPS
jgi:hypothetical protein